MFAHFKRSLMRLGLLPDERPIGIHQLKLLSRPEELENEDIVPTELLYVFSRDRSLKKQVRSLLGKKELTVGVRTTVRTPERVVQAIERVSRHSQKNCITTWLPQFVKENREPVITKEDFANARKNNVELDEELDLIARYRGEYKRIMIIHEDAKQLTGAEAKLAQRMNTILAPVETEYAARSMVFDSAHARTEIAQSIIKAMIIIGPIAHVLEHYARGWGKVFAASVDDVMSEVAELSALRASGFSWSSLAKRSIILIPVFALATWALLQLDSLFSAGHYTLGGLIFGLSAVALSLTTAIQSVFMFRTRTAQLRDEGKLSGRRGAWREAIVQDFTNPARVGLFCGAIASPLVAATIFTAFHGVVHNGWVLALLGTTETIVAGTTVIFSRRLSEWRFKRSLERMTR